MRVELKVAYRLQVISFSLLVWPNHSFILVTEVDANISAIYVICG